MGEAILLSARGEFEKQLSQLPTFGLDRICLMHDLQWRQGGPLRCKSVLHLYPTILISNHHRAYGNCEVTIRQDKRKCVYLCLGIRRFLLLIFALS